MTGLGVSEDEAMYYEQQFKEGKAIVTVKAAERADDAVKVIRQHGGFVRRDEIPPDGPAPQPPLIAGP
jgi:transcriptional regulator of NAD metabolism